jgi:hypothetical protein
MSLLVYCLAVLLSAFLIHLIVWRIRIPKRQTNALLQIFFGTYLLSIPLPWILNRMGYGTVPYFPQTVFDYAQTLLNFTACTLAYVITYSAIEADSPSLVIVKLISEAGAAGLDGEALHSRLSDDVLVIPRVNDLLRDTMAVLEGDRVCLTSKGRWFVRIFIFYRALINAQRGG